MHFIPFPLHTPKQSQDPSSHLAVTPPSSSLASSFFLFHLKISSVPVPWQWQMRATGHYPKFQWPMSCCHHPQHNQALPSLYLTKNVMRHQMELWFQWCSLKNRRFVIWTYKVKAINPHQPTWTSILDFIFCIYTLNTGISAGSSRTAV